MDGSAKRRPASSAAASSLIPSFLDSSMTNSTPPFLFLFPPVNWRLLRRLVFFFLSLLLRLILLLLSPLFPSPPSSAPVSYQRSSITDSCSSSAPARALSRVLSVVSVVPVSSRKYQLARSLADRLLDENLLCFPAGRFQGINLSVLSEALAHAIRRLESVLPSPAAGPVDLIAGALWSGLRRIGAVDEDGIGSAGSTAAAEKLVAEVLWLAQKMAECDGAGEAVVRWAAAASLGRSALAADPRIQVGFVRVSVFLFRQAHRLQAEVCHESHGEDEDERASSISHCCLSMLRTWLPLLCGASSGVEMPTLSSSGERAEMVRVLEELIGRLNWEQQEEVLATWLDHFAACPDSDWPNLDSCYTRWYAESRKQLLK
ncbi:hypothetical protein AXF42_Ash009875 [Apostasia shenzhenica]|uniref:BTB/POZ domain-containing protein n=1 Tax=Apostasia shenzhenica TaxID=1088818 RepID=A0A2I0ACA8_9ASPA|nr:hypothetical protein AXF42_Ash009875 [Apostasia shenzhenica]